MAVGGKRGLLAGPKFSNKHSTVVAGAVPVVEFLRDRSDVSKVVISIITYVKGDRFRVKSSRVQAGLKVTVRARSCVQEFFAYTDEPDAVANALTERFG